MPSLSNQTEGERAGTLASSVFDKMRNDILSGELPPGEKLRVEYLRTRYGVGASPIREALNRLSVDGVVMRVDQKGFRVAEVSVAELDELIKTRCWRKKQRLQSIAAGDDAWEGSWYSRFTFEDATVGDQQAMPSIPNGSHEGISSCPNRRLWVAMAGSLLRAAQRSGRPVPTACSARRLPAPQRAGRTSDYHERRYLEDSDTAVEALMDHYHRTAASSAIRSIG